MLILVTGAAGYIGSVVTEQLIADGHFVVAIDSLRHGYRAAVHPAAQFERGDLLDRDWLRGILRSHQPDAVIHLAAEALVDESVRNPSPFFGANVSGGLNLLDAMIDADVKKLVFSSTAAVYGEPSQIPIREDDSQRPVNAYGESKLAFERALPWYEKAYGLHHITLRYFNACGATEGYGEFHVPETHLIPTAFEAALGQRESMQIFGTDYDTPDGTCIRDYIHVSDIAEAHILALRHLGEIGAAAYNMGNGSGYSNREVLETVRRVTGSEFPIVEAERRPGDPARLVASSDRIRRELGWQPKFPQLEEMIASAWRWRTTHPEGYAS